MTKNIFDLHNELIVQRVGEGIQLVNLQKCNSTQSLSSLENLGRAPFHVCFMDKNSVVRKFNERGAKTFNLDNCEDAIGLTARDVSSLETAEYSIANNHKVIQTGLSLLCDEPYIRHIDTNSGTSY